MKRTQTKPVEGIPAIGYIRMSTDTQKDSPERQRREIIAMAERDGYTILGWYEDHGKTGTKTKNRPEFQRLMIDATKGEFKAVLMYEQSRFTRESALDAMTHWKILADAGVSLVSVQSGVMSLDSLAGLLTAIIGQDQASTESKRLALRSMSGKRMKAETGAYMGPTPFGYDREIIDEKGNVVKRVSCRERFIRPKGWTARLVPSADPKETDAVKFAFDSIAQGVSMRKVAAEFNRRGLTTKQGLVRAEWIRKLIKNPVYLGIARYGFSSKPKVVAANPADGVIMIPNAHPAIVNSTVAEIANQMLDAIYTTPGGTPGRYLLGGLVHCGHCGRKMGSRTHTSYRWADDGVHRQYSCKKFYPGTVECELHPCISADTLEAMILQLVAKHYLSNDRFETLREASARLAAGGDGEQSFDDVQLKEVQHNIKACQRNMALAKEGQFDAIAAVYDELLQKETMLQDRVRKNRKCVASFADLPFETVEQLGVLRENLHLADKGCLSASLKGTIQKINVFKQHERVNGVLIHQFHGTVEFISEVLPIEPVKFFDGDLFPNRPYMKAADYVKKSGRPVRTAEIAEALGVHATVALIFAKRAVAHGLLKVIRKGVFSSVCA